MSLSQPYKHPKSKSPLGRFVIIYLILIALGGGLLFFYNRIAVTNQLQLLDQTSRRHVEVYLDTIIQVLLDLSSDLRILKADTLIPGYLSNGAQSARAALGEEIMTLVEAKQKYDQVSFIGLDGRELLRINNEDGAPRIVPPGELQNKFRRYYFTEGLFLAKGQIYISPLDLNLEQGRVKRPLKPMVRLVTPLFDRKGNQKAMLVINYLGNVLFARLANDEKDAPGEFMLLNRKGYWLKGPWPEDEWGFLLPQGLNKTFARRFPSAWAMISSQDSGQFRLASGVFTFATMEPYKIAGDRDIIGPWQWKIVYWLKPEVIAGLTWPLQKRHLIVFLLFGVCCIPLAWLAAQTLARRQAAEDDVQIMAQFPADNPNPVMRIAGDGRLLYANSASRHLLNFWDVKEGDTLSDEVLAPLRESTVHGELKGVERKIGDQSFWFLASLLPDKQAMYLYAIDVTSEIFAIEKLRQSEANLNKAQALVHVGNWDVTFANGKLAWSAENYRIFGRTPQESVDSFEAFLELVHPDDRQLVKEALDKALHQQAPLDLEHRIIRPDGSQRMVHVLGEVTYDQEGKPLSMLGTVQDITERREAQDQLEMARKVFDSAVEGITVTDAQGDIQYVNHAFTTITGYSQEEALGKNPSFLTSGRHDADFYKQMWNSITEQGHWQGELWNRRKSGEVFSEKLSIVAIKDTLGRNDRYVSVFHDISDIKKAEDELTYKTNYDALTDLPNKVLFATLLSEAIARAQRINLGLVVLSIDLDQFNQINSSQGYANGDLLLQAMADRLRTSLLGQGTIARPGQDQFLVFVEEAVNVVQKAVLVAQRVQDALRAPFQRDGHETFITACIGVAVYPEDGNEPVELIANAEIAMRQAKAAGPNEISLFTAAMNQQAKERMEMTTALRLALEREEFLVYYQPKVDLETGRMNGMEALVRWQSPGGNLVAPDEFIPLAEDTGLIVPMGKWVLGEACRQTKAWREAGHPDLRVAVNLSARQLQDPTLVEIVTAVLEETGLPADGLELEITESAVMVNFDFAESLLRRLREKGVKISLDDFGTGYSSLSYLRRLPIDSVKIDKSFVDDLPDNPEAVAVAITIISMTHSLGLKAIAEGVETSEQLEFMRDNHCDQIQGYFFSPPLPSDKFSDLLTEGRRLDGTKAQA